MTHRIVSRHYSPRRPGNVVVADYDTDEASALAEGLREDGCSVTIATTGVELPDLLCKPRTSLQHIDCVIATTMWPGTDAIDVLRMGDGSAAATVTVDHVRSHVQRLLARDPRGQRW